jgi:hypothetical protein
MEPDEHFVRGVLQAGVRLVELPGGLGGQLTELVAIRNVGECPIDQIGTHEDFLSFLDGLGAVPHGSSHWTPTPQSFVVSLTSNDAQPSKKMQKCATHDNLCFPRFAMLGIGNSTSGAAHLNDRQIELRDTETPLFYRFRDARNLCLGGDKGAASPLAGLTLSLTLVEVNTFFIGLQENYPHICKKVVKPIISYS